MPSAYSLLKAILILTTPTLLVVLFPNTGRLILAALVGVPLVLAVLGFVPEKPYRFG